MKTTYFTTFQLGKRDKPLENYSELYKIIRKWLEKPIRGFKFPKEYNFIKENIDYEDDGHHLSTMYNSSTDYGKYLAIKYEHPDSSEKDIKWRTEIIIGDKIRESDTSSRIAVRTSYGGSSPHFRPVRRYNSRPSIINQLLNKVGAFESLPLIDGHLRLPETDIEQFMHVLSDEKRYLPILFISKDSETNQPIIDIEKLTSKCSGLAYILLADDKNVTWKLDTFLGTTHNCFDGAVRIYWPKFKVSDNRFSHPLWTSDKIEQINQRPGGFESYIFNILCDHSSSRFVHEALTWEGANRVFRKIEIEELKKTGDKDEWIALLEEDNLDLNTRLEGIENQNDALRDENFQLRSQIEQLKFRLNDKDTTGSLSEELEDFGSTDQIIDHFNSKYPEFIEIPKNIKINNQFEDLESLFKALKWLTLTYRKSRLGELSIPDLKHSCLESSGFFYEPKQSDITVGMYSDEYKMRYKGEKRTLKEHMGQGSSKDPRYTIRVAFFFDEEDEKVVIGYMGQHQKTRST